MLIDRIHPVTRWWGFVSLLGALGLSVAGCESARGLAPRLVIANDAGRISCSADVGDEEARAAIQQAMRATLGRNAGCDIGVTPTYGSASWLPNLETIFTLAARPDTEIRIEDRHVQLGGGASGADRAARLDVLRTAFGPEYAIDHEQRSERERWNIDAPARTGDDLTRESPVRATWSSDEPARPAARPR